MNVTTFLAPLDSTDIGVIRAWRNDWRVWKWCRQSDLISDVAQVNWFKRQSEDPTIKMYKLMVKTEDKDATFVGVGGLTSVDHFNSRAELSFYLCPEMQGQGAEDPLLSVLLDHAFTNLGLGLVFAEVFQGNPIAGALIRLGLSYEGRRRQFYWKDGQRIDAHLYSITAREWHDLRNRQSGAGDSAPGASALGQTTEAPEPIDWKPAYRDPSAGGDPPEGCPAKAHRELRRGARAKGARATEAGGG